MRNAGMESSPNNESMLRENFRPAVWQTACKFQTPARRVVVFVNTSRANSIDINQPVRTRNYHERKPEQCRIATNAVVLHQPAWDKSMELQLGDVNFVTDTDVCTTLVCQNVG